MPETSIPTITLANGVQMPAIGLGTSPMNDDETEKAVIAAIATGYRLIDTAENYRNEVGVGRGIRASGIDRSELFVTTKFNKEWHSIDGARQAFDASARRLGLDYIDLLLIHWPNPALGQYVEAWKGMIKLLEDGKVRAIGLSNFKPAHIDRIIAETGVVPHVDQVQYNPYVVRETDRAYHASKGIVTETWSPIGRGSALLGEPVLAEIASRHGKTPAQVILRWHVQQGMVPIPKSGNPERLAQNIDVFDFTLSDAEMASISGLDKGGAGAADSDVTGH